jgi:PAS domain S-box-containing protein
MSDEAGKPIHRILVIDDNPMIHEDFRKILCPVAQSAELEKAEAALFGETPALKAEAKFVVDSAYQGQEGLALVQRALAEDRPYAMAFVDVRMPPGWDGVETIGHIWRSYPDLQIVICTAYSDYSWEAIVQRLGQSDNLLILKKPFDSVEVLQLAHALTKKWVVTRQAQLRMSDLERLVRQRTGELQTANDKLQLEVEQRAEAEEALRLSEERFSKAFRSTPLPLAILAGKAETVLDVNESFLQMSGYERSEILRCCLRDLRFWTKPEEWENVLQRLAFSEPVRNRPCQVSRKNGARRDTLVSVEPFTIGQEPCLLLIAEDITERLRLENQLRHAQKMDAIGQLAAGVAHDFNNLLTIIQGHTSLQLGSGKLDPDAVKSLQEVQRAAERAAALTRQLLAFSRKQVMQSKPLNASRVIEHLREMLARLIGEHIKLTCACPDHLPPVLADEPGIEQVVLNLVVNARDAMPKGGSIEIATQLVTLEEDAAEVNPEARPGRFICLSVSDTGCGMEPAVLNRIFEPFFTTKEVGKGTGLGLSTVYGIVKQHRGWVEVTSEVGQGSCFRVFLPSVDQAASASFSTTCFFRPRPVNQEGETVLVVEDNHPLRALACETLRRGGYRVFEAADAHEALRVWREIHCRIDLLLTDVVLPNRMSGVDLAKQLRTEDEKLKIILSSGYSPELEDDSLDLIEGVNFLPKPYAPKTLLKTVRCCLDTDLVRQPASAPGPEAAPSASSDPAPAGTPAPGTSAA